LIESVSLEDGVDAVLTSLLSDRLAVLAGAGLSMAPPSSLPSAAALAAGAKARYDATYTPARPALIAGIEEQAEYFFQRGELATVYLRTLIDQHAFAGQPNPGHYAMADLLLVQAIRTAVTTKVDTLVDTAGQMLFGQVGAGIDADAMAVLPANVAPLLKIHGCRVVDLANTVWAPGQLAAHPVADRIAGSAQWLGVHLADRDLLIVGYWTDWDYLNQVLGATLGAITPAQVTIVDPADPASFPAKAPELYAMGERATVRFQHVKASGADFLAALRLSFSKTFVRRVLHAGSGDFAAVAGQAADQQWLDAPSLDNEALWRMRRDLEGRLPREPAKERIPSAGPMLGLTLLQLRARGAVAEDSLWVLDGRRIRVLRAEGKALHRVEAEFEHDAAPVVAPDIVVAVGAEALSLPPNIARAGTAATIARGSASRWMTRPDAALELGL